MSQMRFNHQKLYEDGDWKTILANKLTVIDLRKPKCYICLHKVVSINYRKI